jgi:MFS family permease
MVDLQWVVNGYMLTLASLILVGGALGDRLGRKRTYLVGVAGFAVASVMCALAASPEQLVAFRLVQGVSAALLTPGGLALIQGTFRPEDRAAAIGTWAAFSGIAAAIGPFVGGFLIENAGWRWIFAINVPLCALVLLLGVRMPESRGSRPGSPAAALPFDVRGAAVGVLMLAATTYLLTAWQHLSVPALVAWTGLVAVTVVGFIALERRPGAMMPLVLFSSRVFSAANAMTFLVYGALGAVSFFLVLQLQVTAGYTALQAGLASLPMTIALLLLSSRFSKISARTGPRLPMTLGPIVCALGVLLMIGVDADTNYWTDVLPGMTLFALGLAGLVSPLTVAVLAAAPDRHAGVASGINNAVARAGSLLAVAALPALVGLSGADYQDPDTLTVAYRQAQVVCTLLLAGGGVVSWFGLRGTGPLGANPAPSAH